MDLTSILVHALKLARAFIDEDVRIRQLSYLEELKRARSILNDIDGALYEAETANEQPPSPPANTGGEQ
jgi:hypothetical protein